jgi:uncharacterized protein YciI
LHGATRTKKPARTLDRATYVEDPCTSCCSTTSPPIISSGAQYRNEHLSLAWAAQARGELILAGALADPVDGAVFLFQGDSPAIAEAFAKADPYVRNGLVTRWRVRPWTTVVGENAASPVLPSA